MRRFSFFAILVGVVFLFCLPQNADAARDDSRRHTVLPRDNADPSFYPLAPCPSCSNADQPVLSPVTQNNPSIAPANEQPDPCDNSYSDNRKHSKHKKHKGAISGGMEELLKMLLELINKLIELLGGSPIQNPQTPEEPDQPEQKEQPEQPDQPDQPEVSQAPEQEQPDEPDAPEPCDPNTAPSAAPQPSQAASLPGAGAPSAAPQPSGAAAIPQPSGAAVPMPSGSAASACVAPPGAQLQDQDPNDSQLPWKRTGTGKVVITFATNGVPADWVKEMQKGVDTWNRSACLDTKLVPTCQPNTYCVPVVVGDGGGDDGNFNATEQGGFTVKGDIQILSTLSGGSRTNVMIHEMGHAVGLAHRKTTHVLMNTETYADVFDPDEIDYQNLNIIYGNQK